MSTLENKVKSQAAVKTTAAFISGLTSAVIHHPLDRFMTVRMSGSPVKFFSKGMLDGFSVTVLSKVANKFAFFLALDQLPKLTKSLLFRADIHSKVINDLCSALAIGSCTSILRKGIPIGVGVAVYDATQDALNRSFIKPAV